MRHTKTALLLFGAALLLGLVVRSAEITDLEFVAGATIALSILLVPAGLVADLRGGLRLRFAAARKPARKAPRRRPPPARRRPRSRG